MNASPSDRIFGAILKRLIHKEIPELNPCPACGNPMRMDNLRKDGARFVICTNYECLATGPMNDPEGEKWNAMTKRIKDGQGDKNNSLHSRFTIRDVESGYEKTYIAHFYREGRRTICCVEIPDNKSLDGLDYIATGYCTLNPNDPVDDQYLADRLAFKRAINNLELFGVPVDILWKAFRYGQREVKEEGLPRYVEP